MTIGETLRKAREAHGLSLEDVKNATLMLTRQIEELENDDFSSFAAPVYGKGFIRLYARTVGLDPDPLVAEYLARASARPDPSRDQPLVPLETIAEEGGAIEVVRPEPHPAPAHAPAPQPKPAPAPAARPANEPADAAADASAPADDLFAAAAAAAAAPKPAPAPEPQKSAPFEKRAAPLPPPDRKPSQTSETFEKRAAPLPSAPAKAAPSGEPAPEKRIAPVEPGMPPPAPPTSDRGERRNEVRIEFSDRPVVKRLAEEEADDAPRAALSDHPVAPPAVPLSVPPFVFPEPPVAAETETDGEPLLRAEPAPAKTAAKPRAAKEDEEEVEKPKEERPAGPFRMRLRGLGSALRARLAALRARFSKKADETDEGEAVPEKEAAPAPRRSRPMLLDADPDEAPVPSRGARWRRPALIGGAAAAVVLVLALLFSRCSGSPQAPKPAGAAQTNAPAATAPAAPQQAATPAPLDAGTPGEDWSTPRRILDPPRSFAR